MLTFLANYAASQNLPYGFVEWALDNYGHDAEDYPLTETLHREWNDWQETADNMQADYTDFELMGTTYWARSV